MEVQNKDDIGAIKNVESLIKEGKFASLFEDARKAKLNLTNFSFSVKERIADIKQKQIAEQIRTEKQAEQNTAKPKEETVKIQSVDLPKKQEDKKSAPEKADAPKTPPAAAYKPAQTNQEQQKPQRERQVYKVVETKNRPPLPNGGRDFRSNSQQRPFNNQGGFNRPGGQFNNGGLRPAGNFNNRPAAGGAGFVSRTTQGTGTGFNRTPRPLGPAAGTMGVRKPFMGKTAKADLTSAASVFVNKERDYSNKRKSSEHGGGGDEKRMSKRTLLRRGLIEEKNIEERMVSRKLKLKKQKQEETHIAAPVTHAAITTNHLTVKLLSEKIGKPVTEIMKQFMALGVMTTINSVIDFATAELVAGELGIALELKTEKSAEEKLKENKKTGKDDSGEERAPIVTVMGHVDHGKTSLLDYIRNADVAKGEAGGITQHIGAYSITAHGKPITFIDTPGHAAFSGMRSRGAQITDIAILIVAADDGVKPQTVEAIKYIKEAKVPIIVAINKIDKPGVNIEKIKQQLTEHDILPEEWGGDAIVVPVSAKTGEGIDKLLEMILLVSEVQNLRANSKRAAVGTVIESKLDKGLGPVANVIVRNGTLKIGDHIVSGFAYGRVRALIDDKGKNVRSAGPSEPVSILGFNDVPDVGEDIHAVDEKLIKNVVAERKNKLATAKAEKPTAITLDEFLNKSTVSKKILNIIIKGDVQGSVEALKQSLEVITNDEVKVEAIKAAVGSITERDVSLAEVSNAEIIAFNVKADSKAAAHLEKSKVSVKYYNIIYQAIDDIEAQIKAMREPKFEERIVGHAEITVLFKISRIGTIAGSIVKDGKIMRGSRIRVMREGKVIFEGDLETLQIEKQDVKEAATGFGCGIKLKGFNDFVVGDMLECVMKFRIDD